MLSFLSSCLLKRFALLNREMVSLVFQAYVFLLSRLDAFNFLRSIFCAPAHETKEIQALYAVLFLLQMGVLLPDSTL